tara:strand:+ start:782 stop:1072 length:291 start_codon:yes stop_codon:yes gene_type:complete
MIIVFLMTLLILSCDNKLPDIKVYEIKDIETDSTHTYRTEPKLKKHILFCTKHKTNEVVYVHWNVNQTPAHYYFVEPYKNYLEKTWVEQHYERRAK